MMNEQGPNPNSSTSSSSDLETFDSSSEALRSKSVDYYAKKLEEAFRLHNERLQSEDVYSLQSSVRSARQDLKESGCAVQSTTDLVGSVCCFLRFTKELRDVMNKPAHCLDLAMVAEIIRDVGLFYKESGLSEFSVVEDKMWWLSEIEKAMDRMMSCKEQAETVSKHTQMS